jgi:uncharacterized protein YehS (DUF1456 family)
MINNVTLKRVSNIFDFSDDKICSVFKLGQCDISAEQLTQIFVEKNDPTYKELLDVEFASFLNGLIIEKRGPSDGPARQAEDELTNNAIFNKVKIALALKADEVLTTLELGNISLGKYELSAFFRNVNHKNYKECSDDVLSAFLKGLKISHEK